MQSNVAETYFWTGVPKSLYSYIEVTGSLKLTIILHWGNGLGDLWDSEFVKVIEEWPCYHCTMCCLGILGIAVKTLSHWKTIFLRLFFLCSFDCTTICHWTIWHQDNKNGQYGTRTIWHRTIWHQDNLAPDNLATGQFGTKHFILLNWT